MKNNTISLTKFLSRYLGIVGEDTKHLKHDDIAHLFPDIKRSSFSFINNNKGVVEKGIILLVNDGERTIPYYAPAIIGDLELTTLQSTVDEKNKKKKVIDYANMNIYELKQLLNVRFNGYHVSRTARKELEDRGVTLRKKYNREEFKKWRKDYERD